MNICYLDVNESSCIESYSPTPNRYGGGRVVAAALLERLDNFHIYANGFCFDGIPKEKWPQCHILCDETRAALRNGAPIKQYIPEADSYDIFFHHFSNIHLNMEGCRSQKQAVWPVGWHETVNPLTKHVLLFDQAGQEAQMSGPHTIHNIVIGPKFHPFQERVKEDFIFQCSRHFSHYRSTLAAQLALKYGIQTVFAGPIESGYPLKEYIDGKTTHYLGVIDQATKEDMYKRARYTTQLQDYPISVTLAGKEAASFGCGILASSVGGWRSYINDGLNGFFINGESDYVNAWGARHTISQEYCYKCGEAHSEERMVQTVLAALEKIAAE